MRDRQGNGNGNEKGVFDCIEQVGACMLEIAARKS